MSLEVNYNGKQQVLVSLMIVTSNIASTLLSINVIILSKEHTFYQY